ncbi:caskin-2-like isoform X1, partial [Arapaima gigas]
MFFNLWRVLTNRVTVVPSDPQVLLGALVLHCRGGPRAGVPSSRDTATMGKEQELLQAVKNGDLPSAQKLVAKVKTSRS